MREVSEVSSDDTINARGLQQNDRVSSEHASPSVVYLNEAGGDALSHPPVVQLDSATLLLVRLAALLAGGAEADVRAALTQAVDAIEPEWVEELILQTYLFAGFPRSLNGAREWRRISGRAAPLLDEGQTFDGPSWTARGEKTCATVYGRFYEQLRENIRELHPALDSWMIVEGYGKVLSRPGLELWRRELCIVAACAIGRQDRQLHSHLHGSLHAGTTISQVSQVLESLRDLLSEADNARYKALWQKVQSK